MNKRVAWLIWFPLAVYWLIWAFHNFNFRPENATFWDGVMIKLILYLGLLVSGYFFYLWDYNKNV